MIPQYQFNLGQADPLLNIAKATPDDYINTINQEIERLEAFKKQVSQVQTTKDNIRQLPNNKVSLWDTIDTEISSLTNEQKQILTQDETYINIDRELQMIVQAELVNSVKDRIEQTPRGRELLEAQIKNIKDKKSAIVAESNKEIELFKKFQIAVRANPNLTYPEFIKTINE